MMVYHEHGKPSFKLGVNQSFAIHLFIRVVVSRDRICRTASLFIFIVSPWALMTFI